MPGPAGPMTLIVLAAIGLLACAFYIYVLYQWTRDGNGKRTNRPLFVGPSDGTQENKRPYIVGSRKIAETRDHLTVSVRLPQRGWNKSERMAHQKIASSLSSRNRS
jgi:hypothetical protein